ncbi:acylase [Myxococcota bacterium]
MPVSRSNANRLVLASCTTHGLPPTPKGEHDSRLGAPIESPVRRESDQLGLRWVPFLLACLVGCGDGRSERLASAETVLQQSAAYGGTACGQARRAQRSGGYCAEVRRTSFGVPHIKAHDELGLGYGMGYAYAEDNVCLLADGIVTVRGERSKYFGPDGSYDPDGTGRSQTNLSSDFYFKYLNESGRVRATWQHQPKEIQALARGYAAGYNRYLREVGGEGLPEACRSQPWVRRLTGLDVLRLMRRYAVAASGISFIDDLFAAQPPAMTVDEESVTPPDGDSVARGLGGRLSRPLMGSNGVALGRDATESGAGMLLANPHFPWTSLLRFYQAHVTIPGKVDAMGVSLPGFPGINIGFNRNVAWTHTVNTSAHFVVYALQLDPDDSGRYVVDGESKPMIPEPLRVEVKDSDGTLRRVRRSYFFSEFGPLISWNSDTALALRDANFDNDRMFQQWWAMNQARSLAEFRHSVETIVGLPWVHAIAADRRGSVYYSDVTPVPDISDEKAAGCISAEYQPQAAAGVYVLNGNTAGCKWETGFGARQEGIFAAARLPTLLRSDYVQNSNDSAWLTQPAEPLTGFPEIVSREGYEQSGRTRIGLSQIAARLAGTDGLPGNRFDLSSLQTVALSNRSMYAGVLLADMKTACAGVERVTLADGSEMAITKGCDVLAQWDGTANLDSVGWPLFSTWRQLLSSSGIEYYAVPFDPAEPVDTPRGLRVGDAGVRTAALRALAQAMITLDAQGLDYTQPWGQIQVFARHGRSIPIHGGGGNEIYNTMLSLTPVRDGQIDVAYGSSAIWTVSFEGDTPIAQGFLTYSQSSNPESPHYADQTQRFSDMDWITFPFTDQAIEADPEYKTKTLTED